jgi:hypothetical protein
MPTPEPLPNSRDARQTPQSLPLNETVWKAWLQRGREQEARDYTMQMKAVEWISLAAILAGLMAGWWSELTPYDVAVRFLVAAGGMALMVRAYHAGSYALAAVFGALVLLYNPVVPVFDFSGHWQRAVMVATALPVVASLTTPGGKLATQ